MNTTIFYFLHNLSHQYLWFDNLVIFIAGPFANIVILIAIIFLLFHHDVLPSKNPLKLFLQKWREIILVLFSGIIAWIFAQILKILIHSPRPFEVFTDLRPLFIHGGMDSFPSGHATFFSALALSIFISHKKVGYIFSFFAVLIGLSRIIAGVHFPMDILGGFILGPIIAFLVLKFQHKYR